jgi:hypothetical protein
VFAAAPFLHAGMFDYWRACVYLLVFFGPAAAMTQFRGPFLRLPGNMHGGE